MASNIEHKSSKNSKLIDNISVVQPMQRLFIEFLSFENIVPITAI